MATVDNWKEKLNREINSWVWYTKSVIDVSVVKTLACSLFSFWVNRDESTKMFPKHDETQNYIHPDLIEFN